MMTFSQIHDARVSLAKYIAKDIVKDVYSMYLYEIFNNNEIVLDRIRRYVKHAIQPFIISNDIKDVEIKVGKDKDEMMSLDVILIPVQYVEMNYMIDDNELENQR